MPTTTQVFPLWPLIVYFAAVLILVAGMLGVAYFFGARPKNRPDADPYESGMMPTGSARVRFDVLFFLNAMFFVVFDLETMFIVAWAIAFRQAGWAGYIEILIFVVVLFAALVYLWRLGALDWRTPREKIGAAGTENRTSTGSLAPPPSGVDHLSVSKKES